MTQAWVHEDGRSTCEARYFICSLAPDTLCAEEKLALVRLHWGIENGHHWTLDVALEEEARQPVQTSPDAIEVVAWLRMLGYNLVTVWRAKAPRKDGRPVSWARAKEMLGDALLLANFSRPELLAPVA